ncbi:adenylate/guanylate cyclase domain-containing protein [Parasphingorhabdus halotolerans]|uniref:Adenylate/guanylate cyclase domain-containing protein n=1 Tax=Parasphingorhabdus halotolerans TaxID=2725558 RepID=A0A6H2DJJ0_9SPHN|nr:adenylate/guanylate cyclase domain-containing protein [Parasphingorhabdus halotolerans]QJB68849.1 adenylate/guanylate cyclase domain-containing protein [Parasphingorhabdus halotolerans]
MSDTKKSKHLDDILTRKHGAVDAQIVFIDIVDYSKRKSTIQKKIIEQLQIDISECLNRVGQSNIEYIQNNNLNFSTDVIRIPTGDGAAICFTFSGLQMVGLNFATNLLKNIYENIESNPCEKFEDAGWCNCHTHYNLRIGINEGKCILYNDINGLVNVAGGCINDAARIMSYADPKQILVTDQAFNNLIDMTTDNQLEEKFRDIGSITVKHKRKIPVSQYIGENEDYIASNIPIDIQLSSQNDKMMEMVKFPFTTGTDIEKEELLGLMTNMSGIMEQLLGPGLGPIIESSSTNNKSK